MKKTNILQKRVVAITIMCLSVVLGGSWSKNEFSFGDRILSLVGFPTWSNGTTGIHYSGVIGMVLFLLGMSFLNQTLSKKARLWLWSIVGFVFVFSMISFNYS